MDINGKYFLDTLSLAEKYVYIALISAMFMIMN